MGGNFVLLLCLLLLLYLESELGPCCASIQSHGRITPSFAASQMSYVDNNGLFLLSNRSNFGFGFVTTAADVTQFLLVVIHVSTSTVVWTGNRGSPVRDGDTFVFDDTGNAYLDRSGTRIWVTNTSNRGVSSMELLESGNLVLVGADGSSIWQSFSNPTDTLLSNQAFSQGMKLTSDVGVNNLSYSLEIIRSGDMILSADFHPHQPYWSIGSDNRITINKGGGIVSYAYLVSNSWKFYDTNATLLWELIFSDDTNSTAIWAAVLGSNGVISFSVLTGSSSISSKTTIPQDPCGRPAACDPGSVCNAQIQCQCPSTIPSCNLMNFLSCNDSASVELVVGGNDISYSPLRFVGPSSKTTLDGCVNSCLNNCSCGAMFYQKSSGNCYLFNEIGSLEKSGNGDSFVSYIKITSSAGGGGTHQKNKSAFPFAVVVIVFVAIVILSALVSIGIRLYRNGKKPPPLSEAAAKGDDDSSEEDNFLVEGLSGMPIRFSYGDLETATNGFSIKLGQGGFGSVYSGKLRDGSPVAVKKLEGVGQGKKEFRAEVSIIGSIHHHHLVRLRGFCAEAAHRLLVYEYMANGSLDRWLFKKGKGGGGGGESMLDWETRYNIAVGTAKGLAYLHEDCDAKIVHCDIKPENVLLDDHFRAKVSDFGLAKLMTREQSHVFTTLRGTRGYLAPEWITNYAISEKSDVYSYGMVLLELIGGRKNYDPGETSEKSHFPSYAFRMMEEGNLREILDAELGMDEGDDRVGIAIKVALWCIQDDMCLRPSMGRVVQMLEGISSVPQPPAAAQLGSKLFYGDVKLISEGGGTTSSGPSECNSDTYVSAVRLSGPR